MKVIILCKIDYFCARFTGMKKHLYLSCFMLLASLCVLGQEKTADPYQQFREAGQEGQVHLEVDSLLEANYYKLRLQNSQQKGVSGYRIRIFSDSGLGAKEEQQKVRARFLTLFPDIDAYNKYDEPYFKVYVGDCRTQSEALKLYDRIKKSFPNAIRVDDNINIQ